MSIEIVVDLETTVQELTDNIKDNSPFNPKNKIVSAHWRMIEDGLPLLDIAGNLRTRYDWYGNLNDNGEEV